MKQNTNESSLPRPNQTVSKKAVKEKPAKTGSKKKKLFFFVFLGLFIIGAGIAAVILFVDFPFTDKHSYKYEAESTLSVFEDDLVCVQSDGLYGYMNTLGEIVIDFQFDNATKFKNGLAAVEVNGQWFAIDRNGKNVLKDRYDSIFINDNKLITYSDNGKYGVLDKSGTILVHAIYDSILEYSEGLAVIKLNNLYGYIDEAGHLVVNREYDDADSFSDGIGLVKKGDRYAYLNTFGENVTEFIFDVAYPFFQNQAIVAREDSEGNMKYGIINNQGKTVIAREYDMITKKYYSESQIYIAKKDDLFYIINQSGEIINPIGYVSIETEALTTFMVAQTTDGKKNIINEYNTVIIKDVEEYDDYLLVADLNQKYLALKKAGKWFIYDETGMSKLSYECDSLFIFDNVILVRKDNLYGAISLSGTTVIDFLYDEMSPFIHSYAMVKIGDDYGVINDKGETVIPFKYENIITN